jgi:quercetin 2,3-dioxygenase
VGAPYPSRRQVLLAAGVGIPVAAAGVAARARRASAVRSRARDVRAVVDPQHSVDGAGVKLRRALGARALPILDPFLLLDEIRSDEPSDYARGFPTHPHRGFETVTYVLEGAVDHRDSLGNHGHLTAGSLQWMTAGHGIVHSEMPNHEASSPRVWAFQLWVNLPASTKMVRPRYQDIAPARVPEVSDRGAVVRVLAGTAAGVKGPIEGIVTAPTLLDVRVPAGESFVHELAPADSAFLYALEGPLEVGPSGTRLEAGQLAVLGDGDAVVLAGAGRALLVAARPIGEPVARSGPFVMNTEDELRRAWDDYRNGVLTELG